MANNRTIEGPGKINDRRKMDDDAMRQKHRENYRWALARQWQYIYESDSDSEDDGLLTPVSLSSPPHNQNHNQSPQTTQQQHPSPSHNPTAPPPRKIRPYACRVTKSMRLFGPNRPAIGTWGAEAVALHPRRKGWVTFRDRGRQISMTFERYRREHVRIAYSHSFSQLISLADSSRHLLLTIRWPTSPSQHPHLHTCQAFDNYHQQRLNGP